MADPSTQRVVRIAKLMTDLNRPWAFAGGWAIDLFCGGLSRFHKDIDVSVLRRDQLALQAHLMERGWSLHLASKGGLTPWSAGAAVELPVHVVWCRKPDHDPDVFEVLLEEADAGRLLFRKDPAIGLDFDRAITASASPDCRILAPEMVLLYKSRDAAAPASAADFRLAAPRLDAGQRAWLVAALARLNPRHPWLSRPPRRTWTRRRRHCRRS